MNIAEWEPFTGCADLHGYHQNRKVVREFLSFVEDFRPKHRFSLGDDMDITALRKGASDDEKASPLRHDVNMGMEFLDKYRPQVKLNGNHCHRLWLAAKKEGLVAELARKLIEEITEQLRKQKCRIIPYGKRSYYQFGDRKLLHGTVAGVGAARKVAMHFGHSFFGHIHSEQLATFGRVESPVVAMSCPALCKLDADYNNAHTETLSQANGWIYGYINKRSGKTIAVQHVVGRPLLAIK